MFARAITELLIGSIGGALVGAIIFGIGQWLHREELTKGVPKYEDA